ncbi:hypothetical protein AAVH_32545, partial [Aphelenchoides avenae]
MSSTNSAAHPAFLRDTIGRIFDGEDLTPRTLMKAYTSIYNWIANGPKPRRFGDDSPACVEAYNFVYDSLEEHVQTK